MSAITSAPKTFNVFGADVILNCMINLNSRVKCGPVSIIDNTLCYCKIILYVGKTIPF